MPKSLEFAARLDCTLALASLAMANNYVRPTIVDGNDVNASPLTIVGGRHALRELRLSAGSQFVPNDCSLDAASNTMLLSGPNFRFIFINYFVYFFKKMEMLNQHVKNSGKSTFATQTALIVFMAHIGK